MPYHYHYEVATAKRCLLFFVMAEILIWNDSILQDTFIGAFIKNDIIYFFCSHPALKLFHSLNGLRCIYGGINPPHFFSNSISSEQWSRDLKMT